MNKQTKSMNDKPSTPKTSHPRRRLRVADLLCAVPTLGTAMLFMAMRGPKVPPSSGD